MKTLSLYQIGEYAKSNKTVINILAVEGEPVGLPHVQVAAEISGGTVNVLNPLEIVRQLRQIMQNSLVATSVTVTFFLHPDFIFDEPGYPDVCTCMCVCVYVCVCVRVCVFTITQKPKPHALKPRRRRRPNGRNT